MLISDLGIKEYGEVWLKMKCLTENRQLSDTDECWLLEHFPVYTQGQAGKVEHILNPGNIPIIQSDRGGQVTYHGPGQLVCYVMFDLNRLNIGVRTLVTRLESIIIELLRHFYIAAHRLEKAPGVYVEGNKIASIGLRVKNGFTYHGIAINVDMDLVPFKGINPCGFSEINIVQIKDYVSSITVEAVKNQLRLLLQSDFS